MHLPTAFLVKTPTGLLLLVLAGFLGWWALRKDRRRIPDSCFILSRSKEMPRVPRYPITSRGVSPGAAST